MGDTAANMEVATASWWWVLSRNSNTTWEEIMKRDNASNMVFSLAGVSMGMTAILVTSYIAHLVHIMQRVKQNRVEREEKGKEKKKLLRKRLTASACYNNLIKGSQASLDSIQDFLEEDACLSGDEDILEMRDLSRGERPKHKRIRKLMSGGMSRQKSFSLPMLSEV